MFWDNFYKACESKNIKPTALVQKLGLSSSSATTWKKRPPNAETLLILADYLEVSVDYLLGRTEIPEIDPANKLQAEFFKIFQKLPFEEQVNLMNIAIQKAG